MANITPLVRVTGTAHGIRRQDIEAKPEVRDPDTGEVKYEARDASSFDEVGVACRGRFGETITDGNTGTLSIVIGEDDPRPEAGEVIDWLVSAYVRWVPGRNGRRAFPSVAYRFAGVAESAPTADLVGAGAAARPRRT